MWWRFGQHLAWWQFLYHSAFCQRRFPGAFLLHSVNFTQRDAFTFFRYSAAMDSGDRFLGKLHETPYRISFINWTANTLFVALSVTALKLVIDAMAGYALAKLEFRGKTALSAILLLAVAVCRGIDHSIILVLCVRWTF